MTLPRSTSFASTVAALGAVQIYAKDLRAALLRVDYLMPEPALMDQIGRVFETSAAAASEAEGVSDDAEGVSVEEVCARLFSCLLYTSPSPRDS